MSKKCGLICLGLGIVAGYAACKYGDVIVSTVKESLGKKSVEDLAEEIKADSEEKDYIVLPVEENEEEDKVNVFLLSFLNLQVKKNHLINLLLPLQEHLIYHLLIFYFLL